MSALIECPPTLMFTGRERLLSSESVKVFPQTIDANLTGKCNLDCPVCWGPEHTVEDRLNTDNWKELFAFFAERGTGAIVVTGGEPLLRKDLRELLRYAKRELGLQVTLSTNALLLNEKKAEEILPFIDEIGIPLDGSTPEKNTSIRIKFNGEGHLGQWQTALDALHLVRQKAPGIEITVRTVVSKVNMEDMLDLGELLKKHGEVVDRWKLYQFVPVSIGARRRLEHELSDEQFFQTGKKLISEFPKMNIKLHSNRKRTGRYVFIGPEGNIFGVDDKGDYLTVANWMETPRDKIPEKMSKIINPDLHRWHGRVNIPGIRI